MPKTLADDEKCKTRDFNAFLVQPTCDPKVHSFLIAEASEVSYHSRSALRERKERSEVLRERGTFDKRERFFARPHRAFVVAKPIESGRLSWLTKASAAATASFLACTATNACCNHHLLRTIGDLGDKKASRERAFVLKS